MLFHLAAALAAADADLQHNTRLSAISLTQTTHVLLVSNTISYEHMCCTTANTPWWRASTP